MKKMSTIKYSILLICTAYNFISIPRAKAQDIQYKARISAEYHKFMLNDSFIDVNVKFRGEDGYEPAVDLPLKVYYQLMEDSIILVGAIKTNKEGQARFQIKDNPLEISDSSLVYEYVIKIENSDKFRDAKKAVSFADANLLAEVIEIDSVIHISANLTDGTGKPIAEERLKVRIQRMFAPLTIGKPYYETDDEGNILVPFADPLPGIDGILNFEIIFESDDYGIVHNIFESPVGKIIVDESTFDQRTIWSPPSKTPIFLWIFANVLILGAWMVIFLLVANLYKIYKA
jgi:hypothetical protein